MSKEQVNNKKVEKLRFIYQEINESSKVQQEAINMVNQKFNWVIALDIGILALIFSRDNFTNDWTKISLFVLLISLIFSVISLWTKKYKRGPLLTELNNSIKYNEEIIIKGVNKKMVEAVNLNQKIIDELNIFLKISIIFLVLAILFIYLSILTK